MADDGYRWQAIDRLLQDLTERLRGAGACSARAGRGLLRITVRWPAICFTLILVAFVAAQAIATLGQPLPAARAAATFPLLVLSPHVGFSIVASYPARFMASSASRKAWTSGEGAGLSAATSISSIMRWIGTNAFALRS